MIVKLHPKRYEELKEKEHMVEEIQEETTTREKSNFILSHVMVGIGLVITIFTTI